MKRVKTARILQTLVFMQKEDAGLTHDQIVDEADRPEGSVILRVRKQYNDRADVSEYFA